MKMRLRYVPRAHRYRLLAAAFFLLFLFSPLSSDLGHMTVQRVNSLSARRHYRQWPSLETAYFHLRYPHGEQERAAWVGEEADRAVAGVMALLPHDTGNRRPWLVLVPDQETLRRVFKWQEGTGALGVYLADTVKILNPQSWDWVEEDERLNQFRQQGPLIHEYTHYVLDLRTRGNYTRWFSEGLAQLTEYHLLGYEWLENSSPLTNPYSPDGLDRSFDTLSGQPLAYRQALSLVTYMESLQGLNGINRFMDTLGLGVPFYTALEQVYGLQRQDFFAGWQEWYQEDPRWFKSK
jgi:hypothetical protein